MRAVGLDDRRRKYMDRSAETASDPLAIAPSRRTTILILAVFFASLKILVARLAGASTPVFAG